MTAIRPKITNAGLAAAINASNDGVEAKISHIAFGDGNGTGYTPDQSQLSLKRERIRVEISNGVRIAPNEIQVTASIDASENYPEFTIREVGIYLEDGTLFAVWSGLQPIAYRSSMAAMIVAFTLILSDIPPDSINVNITSPDLTIFIDVPFAQVAQNNLHLMLRAIEGMHKDFEIAGEPKIT